MKETEQSICCRTTPLSVQSTLTHLNKRRLEFGVDVETFRTSERRIREEHVPSAGSMDEDEMAGKRRRRLLDDEERRRLGAPHRPFAPRLHDQDDETLIKETQAALKTLSGSWHRDQAWRSHSEDENEEANGFENLFEDKRSDKMLPSSPSPSSESADASQRSFSGQNNDEHNIINSDSESQQRRTIKSERDKNDDEYIGKHSKYPNRYEDAPNFDELVDSSSNELEIDMSDRNDDKYDDDRDTKQRRKSESMSVNKQSLYNAYKAATAALPYSTQSAFKPPAEVKHRLHGTLPSEPFGGYSSDDRQHKGSKQYTVLQPAGAGSRAATALQEARTVPSATPARDHRPLAALSPPAFRGTAPPHTRQCPNFLNDITYGAPL